MKRLGPVCILLAGILWGIIGLFVRTLSDTGYTSMEIVAMRAIITFAVLGVYLLLFGRRYFKIKIKDLWCVAGTGLFSILFFNYCYFTTITLTSLSVASILLYTAPIMVMLLSLWLFHEKLTWIKGIALVMAFAGCVLVAGLGNTLGRPINAQGLFIGLGAGFGYALYSIFGRYALNRGYPPLTITFYTFVFASVGCLFFVDPSHILGTLSLHPDTVFPVLLLGVLTSAAAYLLYTYGLTQVESSRASIMASIEPVVATLMGFFVFGETLSLAAILGIVLVFVSLILLNLPQQS